MFLDWASSSLHLGSCDLAFPAAAQNALRLFICQIKLSLDRILDGGTISHLRSLLLTRPPLDLGGRTTSLLQSLFLTKPAFYLGWGPLLVCDHCFYWMFCFIITPFIRLFWKLVTRTKPLRLYIYWVLDGGDCFPSAIIAFDQSSIGSQMEDYLIYDHRLFFGTLHIIIFPVSICLFWICW